MTIGDDGKTVFETSIDDIDSLDRAIISAGLPTGTGSYIVNIPLKETTLQDIYFFKNMRDLNTLGYEVITYRDRVSKDEQYRADNISTAFKSSGNVVVLNPGDSYSYLNES